VKNSLFKKFILNTMSALVLFPTMNTRVAADPIEVTVRVGFVGKSGGWQNNDYQ
jgi:hypothetical protein